jgi:L-lactate dehydrogenase complex protein LldE
VADVVVFPTCLVEQLKPSLTAKVINALERAGHAVTIPKGVTCCGQPAWNAGFVPEARRVAKTTAKALARTSGPVVVPSGSCAAMMHHYWAELLGDSANPISERVVEFSEFLVATTDPPTEPPSGESSVTYHDSCHMLRVLGIKQSPRRMLAAAGVAVDEMPNAERCCGFGGTFSVKLPDVSVAMADEKLDEAVATGASTVVGCDLSCLMHLEGRASRRGLALEFKHLAEVIDT